MLRVPGSVHTEDLTALGGHPCTCVVGAALPPRVIPAGRPQANRNVRARTDQRGGAVSGLRMASVGLEVAEAAGEVHERLAVGGDPEPADTADDDPVISGWMLGGEIAFDRRERIAMTSGSAKRSAPGAAALRAKLPCRAPRTLIVQRPVCRMRCQVMEWRDGQNETSGGWSETAANELTMSPSGAPSTSAVTKATPVANRPNATRRLRSSRPGSAG
jgi:hypothetical protein